MKKYGKAIEQPQGTLPLHLHSEQTDGQATESKRRQARFLVPDGPLPYLPKGCRCPPSTHSHFFHLDPYPFASTDPQASEKGRAILKSWDHMRVRQKVSAVRALGLGLRGSMVAQGGRGPTHTLFCETSALRLTTSLPRFASGWPQVLKKAMIQDGEAGPTGCVLQKRATDSGVSETNWTLVFQLVQTMKIKAGFRWLRSSDGCCVFLIWQG